VISGRIQTGRYVNKDGNTVYTTDEIIEEQDFAESKAAAAQNTGMPMDAPQPNAPQPSTASNDGFMNIPDGLDEELPFS
jgi:single-strand DNA-binding protein